MSIIPHDIKFDTRFKFKNLKKMEISHFKVDFDPFWAPEFENRYLSSQFHFVFRKNDLKVARMCNFKMVLEKNERHIHDRLIERIPKI